MELKMPSQKLGCLSPPDCISDPEEKEISDDDDDDRNHKHRRREARSQSLERDTFEQVARPYRKRNRPFENAYQSSENWKNFDSGSLEKGFPGKFDKRRLGMPSNPRTPMNFNQKARGNQTFYGDSGPGRGRGRDSGTWNSWDSRFCSVDIASQIVQRGPVPPSLFSGRGFANVSNTRSASWSTFGLVPGIPNGGLDTLPSIGLQGTVRQPINSSLNMGIPRQRCRDFEERGFCLRGDMCPMEHGVNRIVVEDVQSLSQFNLTVSLPNAPLLGPSAVPGSLTTVSAPSALLTNSKGLHVNSSHSGVVNDSVSSVYPSSISASAADLYDPDQPLWNSSCPETSSALLTLQSAKIDGTESMSNDDTSDNECPGRSSQSASLSVWGRIGSSKNRIDVRHKTDPATSTSGYQENAVKEGIEVLANVQGNTRQGKRIAVEDSGKKQIDLSLRTKQDTMNSMRKPSQKALRTLFVNGIPQNSNKKDALLSHFQKFGEVIDIFIPVNSERAFVQFLKMEEAEAALKAPDAVMGNRFIKLSWANRDSIPDDRVTSSGIQHTLSHANRGKDNLQSSDSKGSIVYASDVSVPGPDNSELSNDPKVAPPVSQKKLESLEQLKEELRKKREMLDQKRNDFRRQLVKLEKQATGIKAEILVEQAANRPKGEIAAHVAKAVTIKSTDPGSNVSPSTEMIAIKNNSMENIVSPSPKKNATMVLHESSRWKQHVHPLAPLGSPFPAYRYKLDNRPAAFRIVSPLPAGFANVAVIKEHFALYSDISTVELEDLEEGGSEQDSLNNCTARISFSTPRSAQKAFGNGKCWKGHNLKFIWISSTSSKIPSCKEVISSTPKGPLFAETERSVNGESKSSQSKSGMEPTEAGEDSRPSSSEYSGEKESPKS